MTQQRQTLAGSLDRIRAAAKDDLIRPVIIEHFPGPKEPVGIEA